MGGRAIAGWIFVFVAGCGLQPVGYAERELPPPRALNGNAQATRSRSGVVQAGPVEPATPVARDGPARVDDLVALAVARNPRLAKAAFSIDAAHGRYIQAGLYPNPDLAINWDEIGDRTGPGGILYAPKLSQTIVTGRKLTLAQAVASAEVDQANLALIAERYAVIGAVRAAFYDVYSLERRIAILDELAKLADDAVKNGKNLLDNQRIARLDFVQLEVERERFRAEAEAAKRELLHARRALAAVIGDARLPLAGLTGPYEEVPLYDPDRSLDVVLATNPDARSARVGVERAQAAVRRAQAEAIPNVSVYTAYIRQFENKSNDLALGVNGPIPVWNRNQGGIRAAQAELGAATQEVGRVENELAERVATAFRTYSAARRRAEWYRTEILPRAQETYDLSMKAFQGGQFEYLRVIQAQRVIAEAKLEYNKSLAEAWKGAAQLSGLLLEESWPDLPGRGPEPGPMPPPIPPAGKLAP